MPPYHPPQALKLKTVLDPPVDQQDIQILQQSKSRVQLSVDSQQRQSSSSEDRSVRVCVCCMVESGGYHPSSEGTASASPGLPLSLRTDTAPAPAPTPPSDPSSLTVLQPPPGSFQPAFTHHYTGECGHFPTAWRQDSSLLKFFIGN